MIFPARSLHLFWGLSMAMLKNQRVSTGVLTWVQVDQLATELATSENQCFPIATIEITNLNMNITGK